MSFLLTGPQQRAGWPADSVSYLCALPECCTQHAARPAHGQEQQGCHVHQCHLEQSCNPQEQGFDTHGSGACLSAWSREPACQQRQALPYHHMHLSRNDKLCMPPNGSSPASTWKLTCLQLEAHLPPAGSSLAQTGIVMSVTLLPIAALSTLTSYCTTTRLPNVCKSAKVFCWCLSTSPGTLQGTVQECNPAGSLAPLEDSQTALTNLGQSLAQAPAIQLAPTYVMVPAEFLRSAVQDAFKYQVTQLAFADKVIHYCMLHC
jgi:hypothetical protein